MAATTSSIPTACTQTESTVLSAPIAKVWAVFRDFKLETIAPDFVASTEGSAQVGSMVKITYKDESVWDCQITEVSDRQFTIAYIVVKANPPIQTTSVEGVIALEHVSDGDATFLKWTTECSNDADAQIMADHKYKKLDCFKEFKKNLVS